MKQIFTIQIYPINVYTPRKRLIIYLIIISTNSQLSPITGGEFSFHNTKITYANEMNKDK